jgi:hypothetical protein
MLKFAYSTIKYSVLVRHLFVRLAFSFSNTLLLLSKSIDVVVTAASSCRSVNIMTTSAYNAICTIRAQHNIMTLLCAQDVLNNCFSK